MVTAGKREVDMLSEDVVKTFDFEVEIGYEDVVETSVVVGSQEDVVKSSLVDGGEEVEQEEE